MGVYLRNLILYLLFRLLPILPPRPDRFIVIKMIRNLFLDRGACRDKSDTCAAGPTGIKII